MTERQALTLAGKVTAALIVGAVVITLLIVAFQEAAPQPHLPLVNASTFECRQLQNPCDYTDCNRVDTAKEIV